MTDQQVQAKITEMGRLREAIVDAGENHKPIGMLSRLTEEIRDDLAAEFGRRHGWQISNNWIHPAQLGRRSNQRSKRESADPFHNNDLLDHPFYYRWNMRPYRPAAIAAHIYGELNHPLIEDFCKLHNLACQTGAAIQFPSWWLPGATTLLVYTPA